MKEFAISLYAYITFAWSLVNSQTENLHTLSVILTVILTLTGIYLNIKKARQK